MNKVADSHDPKFKVLIFFSIGYIIVSLVLTVKLTFTI